MKNDSRIRAERLSLSYGERTIVDGQSLAIPDAQITVIVGANACGKSTLLRGLARLLSPTGGRVVLDGTDLSRRSSRDIAQVLGILPQSPVAPEGITVRELVSQGRYPHQNWWQQWSDADAAAVESALSATSMTALAERDVDALSGGQRQRAWIAMAVAQDTDILLLDEPTTYLDIAHQLEVLELVSTLNRDHGRTIVMVLHDLNLAARYAHHLVAMCDGRVVAEGAPREVVTAGLLREVFAVEASILTDPLSKAPVVLAHRTVI